MTVINGPRTRDMDPESIERALEMHLSAGLIRYYRVEKGARTPRYVIGFNGTHFNGDFSTTSKRDVGLVLMGLTSASDKDKCDD